MPPSRSSPYAKDCFRSVFAADINVGSLVAAKLIVGGKDVTALLCGNDSLPTAQAKVLVQSAPKATSGSGCPARRTGSLGRGAALLAIRGDEYAEISPPADATLSRDPTGAVLCYSRDGNYRWLSGGEFRAADLPAGGLTDVQSLVDKLTDRLGSVEGRLEALEAAPQRAPQTGEGAETDAAVLDQIQTLTEEVLRLKAAVAAMPKPKQRAPRRTKAQIEAEKKAKAAEAAAKAAE